MLDRSFARALLAVGLVTGSVALAACSPPPPETPPNDDPPLDGTAEPVAKPSSAEVGQAVEHIKAERFADAIPILEKAVASDPKNAQAQYYLGVSLEGTGKKGDAEGRYKAALAADPGLVEAAQNLAALYLDEPPRPKEAIDVLEAALKKVPGDPKLLHNLGFAKELAGDKPGAIAAYEKSLAKEDTAAGHFSLGNLLFEQKDFDKAVPHLRKAAEGSKDDPATLATIARMMGHAKAFGDCVKLLDLAIAKKGDAAELWVRRGLCKHELGDEPGATADFDGALQVDAKFAPAHYYRGVSLLAQKKKPDAKKALKQAAELGKGTPIEKQAQDKLKGL
jgi:Flp pilus assembly protein TadD